MKIPLTQLASGQKGVVVGFVGGPDAGRRLAVLGLKLGTRITAISSTMMRGPVTVQAGRTQIAIGFGLARKVLVEV